MVILSLLFAVANISAATNIASDENIKTIKIGENIVTITENKDLKLTKYYEDGKCTQESVMNKATNDIYYRDLTDKKSKESKLKNIDLSKYKYNQISNVSDYVTEIELPVESPVPGIRSNNYYQIDIYNYYDEYDDWWYGYLFVCGDAVRAYQPRSWWFSIMSPITVILTILDIIPNIADIIYGGVYAKSEYLGKKVLEYIYENYDWEYIEKIYIAGDGALWIKQGLGIISKSKFVLDRFHLTKYLKKAYVLCKTQ